MNKETRIYIRVSEQEGDGLRRLAEQRGLTLSALVLGLCRAELAAAGYEVAESRHWKRRGLPAPEKPKRPRGRPTYCLKKNSHRKVDASKLRSPKL